jgi:hypothetical protein
MKLDRAVAITAASRNTTAAAAAAAANDGCIGRS